MFFSAAALAVAMTISVGCKRQEQISAYSAPKDSGDAEKSGPAAADNGPAAVMPSNVGGGAELTSVPSGELPPGWKQVSVPADSMFAPDETFEVSASDPSTRATVSHMGGPEARSVLANVNRWAGQLGLAPYTQQTMANVTTPILVGGEPAVVVKLENGGKSMLGAIIPKDETTWFFKLSGPSSLVNAQRDHFELWVRSVQFTASGAAPDGSAAGPAAGPQNAPSAGAPAGGPSPVTNGVDGMHWDLPKGWTATPGNSVRLATIHPGNNAAEIRVSKFAALGGTLADNVNRWRGDVGLPPVDADSADAGVKVDLNRFAATIHDYTGPLNGGTRTIVAIIPDGGQTWFFKFIGPSDVVAKTKRDFDTFLQSFSFSF